MKVKEMQSIMSIENKEAPVVIEIDGHFFHIKDVHIHKVKDMVVLKIDEDQKKK